MNNLKTIIKRIELDISMIRAHINNNLNVIPAFDDIALTALELQNLAGQMHGLTVALNHLKYLEKQTVVDMTVTPLTSEAELAEREKMAIEGLAADQE